jgi:hypothetical protein
MAAKIIFRQSATVGSFDAYTGTGGFHSATRLFYPDGTLLAANTSAWPKWLTGFGVMISGAANTQATNPDCARFAPAGGETGSCDFAGDGVAPWENCGTTESLYRISEYDCQQGTITDGTGKPTDGVYMQATFSRETANLAAHENIMAVIEYAASALNPAPADPTACFTGGVFTPTDPACADQSWQIFLRGDTTSAYSPFFTMIPPMGAYVNTATGTGGATAQTKTVILPLAGSMATKYFLLSRMDGLGITANYTARCLPTGTLPSNSPLCNGVIFYSITFYRM